MEGAGYGTTGALMGPKFIPIGYYDQPGVKALLQQATNLGRWLIKSYYTDKLLSGQFVAVSLIWSMCRYFKKRCMSATWVERAAWDPRAPWWISALVRPSVSLF